MDYNLDNLNVETRRLTSQVSDAILLGRSLVDHAQQLRWLAAEARETASALQRHHPRRELRGTRNG